MAPRRPRPLAFAGAIVRASARASTELVASTARTVERAAVPVGTALVAAGTDVVRRVGRAELGVGPARLSPDGVEWARDQIARGLRQLLTADVDGAELLQAADPTSLAKAVLALIGGDERLVPLPDPDEQIRHRFRALLDPDAPDVEGLTPALLAITAQLSPDEARVLRHLDEVGRLPVISVRAGTRTSRSGPVVAEHLSMAVERSGGDHPERGPEYVGNLLRLGLCAIDDEAASDHPDIALVTAGTLFQDAIAAVRSEKLRPRVGTRALRLTALGHQLVAIALHGAGSGAETARELDGPPPPPPAALRASSGTRS